MVAEQEAAELTGPSKKSSDLVKSLVEYTDQTAGREMDPSMICVEHCNINSKKNESCIYCTASAESFELHSTSDGFFEPDQTFTKCDTWGLSQPFDKHAQHCECFKSCKSSEHRANHSLDSKCSPCCEHCTEHLQLFQQCEPSDQDLESSHSEPDELEEDCESFGQSEIADFTTESTNNFELQEQYQASECSDSEPDTSTEDSEQSEMFSLTPNLSNSTDSLDCGTEVSEYEDVQNEEEFTNNNDDDCVNEQLGEDLSDEESSRSSEETHVYDYDVDSEDVPLEVNLYSEDETAEDALIEMCTDLCEVDGDEDSGTSQDYEPGHQSSTPEESNSETSSEFCSEEDSVSVCLSEESKSFDTSSKSSAPSESCSESSGQSDKGTEEDDEQTQWESFEDEEEIQNSTCNDNNEETKKTPVVDLVIEDYFDLFDRADHYDYMFTKKQRYTSCFDGGDIDHRLYLEEEAQKPKNVNQSEEVLDEMNVQEPNMHTEDESEDIYEENASQRSESSDLETQSGSSLAGDEYESETQENSEGLDDDEVFFEKETCAFEGHVSEVDEEEIEVSPLFRTEGSMFAPFAKEISVEGDAYEDEMRNSQTAKEHYDSTYMTDDTDGEEDFEDQVLILCSEKEPYWSLLDVEENGEYSLPGVEDYYAYQIQSIQSSMKRAINELIIYGHSCKQKRKEKNNEAASMIKKTELEDDDFFASKFGDVIDLNGFFDESEQTSDLYDDSETEEMSKEIRAPSGIIHSVASENAKFVGRDEGTEDDEDNEQSRESEEEQNDEEFYEECECEYCIPPTDQAHAQPLLPQLSSSDGKICVVIDLDETLVHSSFKPVSNADFTIPVEIEETCYQVYVLKRPHVDEFLERMAEMFECVLFTASLSKYADPVSDQLDKCGAFQSRLFRESCVFHKGNYVKDLSRLGRDLNKVLILDNSPASYIFQPDNAVPVASWFDDTSDTELLDLIPFFERLSKADDIYDILREQRTSS